MRPTPVTYRECVVAVLGLLGASIAATWPIAVHMGSALPGDLGDPLLNTWILAWDADRIAHGLRGLWDAPIFFPALRTLTWSEHLLGIAIPLAPMQWLTRNPVLVYNTAFLGSYVLAGLGLYVLARELGLGRAASAIGACACAFAPYRADEVTHLQVLLTGWAPLALAALHRFVRTGSVRAAVWFALAFSLLALSNTYYLFYFAPPIAMIWVYGVINPRVPRRGLIAGTVAAGIIVMATTGPVLFAYWRTQQSTGLTRAWDEIADLSARATDYISVSGASWLWRGTFPVAPAEHALFPGITILVLAIAGVASTIRPSADDPNDSRQTVWLYLVIAALGVWATLGPRSGLYAFALQVVPGLGGLRMVTRLVSVVTVAVAVLAAFGAESVLSNRGHRLAALGAAAFGLLIFLEGAGAPLGAIPFEPRLPAHTRPMYSWLRQQPPGAVLELPVAGPALGEHTLLYQYATLVHGHPIMNGYSGWGSALQDFLASRNSPIYEPGRLADLLVALRAMGVRYVIVHPNWVASQTRAAWLKQAMDGCADQTDSVFYGGDAIAWTLKTAAPPGPSLENTTGLELLARSSYSVAVSAGDDAPRLSDGDLSTRWTSPAPQAGQEWVRIAFSSPNDIRRVTLDLGWRRVYDYPRALTIESIDAAGMPRTLVSGSTLARLLPALIAPGPAVTLAISLPPNQSSALLIRQTQVAPTPWSVDELRLWSARR